MKLFMILLSVIYFVLGCIETKPDNIELTVNLSFPEGVNCKTYLADHFTVTLFNSDQKKNASEEFNCTPETEEIVLYVEKDTYYITVALKGTDGLNKSYGSGTVDALKGDTDVTIEMEEYKGGITFKWNSSDCEKFNINNLKVSLSNEDGAVSSVIWGKESEIDNFEISCKAEMLEIVNIPAVLYSAVINGFRTIESTAPRIVYSVPEFKAVAGQDQIVTINDYKEIMVSDLKIKWEFDSKSIDSCTAADVSTAVASLISGNDTITEEKNCDDKFSTFYFYDIPEGDYEILLRGMNSSDKTLFEGSKEIEIKKGFIGSDILTEEIFLEEK